MLSIGDLARHTRISVRMLRYYDENGLVVPEQVDAGTGYRWYAASQVGRVNALIALKELGFTLAQCRSILDEHVSVAELRGMLRLRQAELAEQIETDTARLAEVSRRLRSIERGLTMTNSTLQLTSLPALRLAQASAEVNDVTEIPAVVGSLFQTVARHLAEAGIVVDTPGVRTYYGRPDGSKIDVAAGVPIEEGAAGTAIEEAVAGVAAVQIVDLPAEPQAATVVHRGPADEIADAWQTFAVATSERGMTSYGVNRQVYLENPDGDTCVVELQCPVREGTD